MCSSSFNRVCYHNLFAYFFEFFRRTVPFNPISSDFGFVCASPLSTHMLQSRKLCAHSNRITMPRSDYILRRLRRRRFPAETIALVRTADGRPPVDSVFRWLWVQHANTKLARRLTVRMLPAIPPHKRPTQRVTNADAMHSVPSDQTTARNVFGVLFRQHNR